MFDKNWNEDGNVIETETVKQQVKTMLWTLASVSVIVSLVNFYFITIISK